MATEKLSFDDLAPVSSVGNDGDDDVRKLEPGDNFVARVRHVEREVGKHENDVLHLTDLDSGENFKYWSNTTISRKLAAAEVEPNDVIGVRKGEEKKSYTDDDGEEIPYYEYEVRVAERGN